MLRVLGATLVLLLACASARADSRIVRDELLSPALGRAMRYMVYLPDGYEGGDLRYPVLYLLHGAGGDEASWVNDGAIQATADRLIAASAIPPAIIVMPGCRTCWWVDGAVDKAETAFWSDLVPGITARYRTIEGRRGRLVAGLSAGGYGAVRFALSYPDRIAAAAALSPAVYAEAPPAISSARTQPPFLRKDGTFDLAAWKAKNYPAVLGRYCAQKQRVAFYLVSGDDDQYGIAFETMQLFKALHTHQPDIAELRIVDGGHSWDTWARSIDSAMRYMFRHVDRPAPMMASGGGGGGVRAPGRMVDGPGLDAAPANALIAGPEVIARMPQAPAVSYP